MILIFGQRICGRVDYVTGTCHVATRFFHLYYIPLIPLSTWIILEGSELHGGFAGRQIPMSFKSVIFGWMQAFLVIFGIVNILGGAINMNRPNPNAREGAVFECVIGLTCLIVWILFLVRPLRASESRANELRSILGLQVDADEEQQFA